MEPDERIAAAKGRESWIPRPFALQIDIFLRNTTGDHNGDRGPSGRHPFAASGAVVVGEGSCPFVGLLLAVCQIQRAHRFRRRADSRNWPPEDFPADGL